MIISGCEILPDINNDDMAISSTDPLEGDWHDSSGIISTFHNGNFQTIAPDTKEKLSEGTYALSEEDPTHVNIEVKSLVKGNAYRVSCSISSFRDRLDCQSMLTPQKKEKIYKNEGTDAVPQQTNFQLWRTK